MQNNRYKYGHASIDAKIHRQDLVGDGEIAGEKARKLTARLPDCQEWITQPQTFYRKKHKYTKIIFARE